MGKTLFMTLAINFAPFFSQFFLLITWAYLADSVCYGSGTPFGGRYGFYLVVTIFGSLSNTCIYVWFLLMLSEKIKLPAAIADGMIVVS